MTHTLPGFPRLRSGQALRLRLIFALWREDQSSLRMTDLNSSAKQNVPDSVRVLGRLLISPPPSAAQEQSSVELRTRIWLRRAITKEKTAGLACIRNPLYTKMLRDHWDVTDPCRAEHAAIALDFHRRAERFRIIIGELHGWTALDAGDFADQADGIEAVCCRWDRSRGNHW